MSDSDSPKPTDVDASGSAICSLDWVPKEIAATWPQGVQVLMVESRKTGLSYSVIGYWRPGNAKDYYHPRIKFSFSRLE